ncbi:type II toxin-antitoxin system RelB/DinJ family antitoxin [Pseudomonas helleri]|nr:type II toxin-antitoxin system RelB/DinJ family antitoxin [Pseudomonas helleri]
MSTNAVVRARIDEHIKEEAAAVLATMGLTVSDAFRMMMTRIAQEKALPFEPLVPNAKTVAAMKEARRGKLQKFATIDDSSSEILSERPRGRIELTWSRAACSSRLSLP